MTIKQLRYIVAVSDNSYNISYTAEKLFTSQPGISKQIKLLEESLNCEIFLRNGKALQGLTPIGEKLVEQARVALSEIESFAAISKNHQSSSNETFRIATTQTQSTYVLPQVIKQFHQKYPKFKLSINDGTMDQLIYIAKNREADCVILSSSEEQLKREWFPNMLMIPCYQWHLVLLCKKGHPLLSQQKINVKDIANQPIVTYINSKIQDTIIQSVFEAQGFTPNIIAVSNDARVLKNYVRDEMGVGIIASMAYDEIEDDDLQPISLESIFPKCTTIIAVERANIIKPHIYEFIKLFAPHLSNIDIERAANSNDELNFNNSVLPSHKAAWSI